MRELLQFLRALYQLYQNFHWRSAGTNYYGDHLLYERLYTDLQDELDKVAEKTIGTTEDLEPVSDSKSATEFLNKMTSDNSSPDEFPEEAIRAEETLLKLIAAIMSKNPSDGIQNLLQEIADLHEGHLYLLKQRAKKASIFQHLMKLADTLDRKALYKEADIIDRLLKSAANKNELIRALKNRDVDRSIKALIDIIQNTPPYSSPAQELGLSDKNFNNLTQALKNSTNVPYMIEDARKIMGIGELLYHQKKQQEEQFKQNTALKRVIEGICDTARRLGGVLTKSRSNNPNLFDVTWKMPNQDAAEEFESMFGDDDYIDDEIFGRILMNGGIIDDGPYVGIELESARLPPRDIGSMGEYLKDVLK